MLSNGFLNFLHQLSLISASPLLPNSSFRITLIMQLRNILPCLTLSLESWLFFICNPYIYSYAFWTSPCGAADLERAGYGRPAPSRRLRKAQICRPPPWPQYLLCSQEPASRSWRRRCRAGTGRDTESPGARPGRCWGTGRSGTGPAFPRAPPGPSAGGGAWSPRTARSSPAPRWATPGRELFRQQEPKHSRALTGAARALQGARAYI